MMSSRRLLYHLNNLRGSAAAAAAADDDDDLCPQCLSSSSCDEFKDFYRLVHRTTSICRENEEAATGKLFSRVSQIDQRRGNRQSQKWMLLTCVLFFVLAFTFLMESFGKEDADVQDYDADVFLPSKALWLVGCLLFWTVWLLLRLLQMFLWLIKVLLWCISISVSPLCHCLSFLLSCLILLIHYVCHAVFFATTCPLYVVGLFLSVCIALLIYKHA